MAKTARYRLPLVPEFLARLIDRYIARKQSKHASSITLDRKRIYILPSRAGWVFMLIIFAILLGAINYNNSLAYLLCFFLGSVVFLAMLYTHQNINHITIRALAAEPVFAGQDAAFALSIENNNLNNHYAIQLSTYAHGSSQTFYVDDQQKQTRLSVKLPSQQRGWLKLDRLKLETEFPLGLFYAWSPIQLDAQVMIYPRPIDETSIHFQEFDQTSASDKKRVGHDEFAGIREYHKGDSPRHMAWKAIARSGQLYTKLFEADVGSDIVLDFNQFDSRLDTETRLSILCAQIIDAERHQLRYSLKLPGVEQPVGRGDKHQHQCLRHLALFKS